MKKLLAKSLAVLMVLSTASISAFADSEKSAEVYVTISDSEGKLALAQEKITVTDIDDDGILTIDDALYSAHEQCYDGGAEAGYGSESGTYGLSMTKLWGTANGSSYGYYVNNISAWSLLDEITDDDYINAFVYTDLTSFSDKYSFFDVLDIISYPEVSNELILSYAGYDENYNPITLPAENAVITLNGEATEFTTDADGKVSITVSQPGEYIISAVSDTMTLVPPVCRLTVCSQDEEIVPSEPEKDNSDDEDISKITDEENVQNNESSEDNVSTENNNADNDDVSNTAGSTVPYLFVILSAALPGGVAYISNKRKKND